MLQTDMGHAMLTAVTREVCGDPAAEVATWSATKLSGGREAISSVFRITVQAVGEETRASASIDVVLKMVGVTPALDTPDLWNYCRREAGAYRHLRSHAMPPGVSTPTCYGVYEHEHALFIWLEFTPDAREDAWTPHDLTQAAHAFGLLNAAYATTHAVPEGVWLSRRWLRRYVEATSPHIEALLDPRQHPLLGNALPDDLMSDLLTFNAERHHWLGKIEALPQTFCHLDAHRANLAYVVGSEGRERLVARDWSFAGIGAIGQELGPMIFTNRRVTDIYMLVTTGYCAGLAEGGWQGDDRCVWWCGALSAALTYGLAMVGLLIGHLRDEREHSALVAGFGQPLEQIATKLAGWARFGQEYLEIAKARGA